jgi:transcriptional regulator with XRE-family HTH domain
MIKNEEMSLNFGHCLEKARREKGKTQDELSYEACVSPRTISDLESGQPSGRSHRAETIINLAVALGKDVKEWLKLCGIDEPIDIDTRIARIISRQRTTGNNIISKRTYNRGTLSPESYFEQLLSYVKQGPSLLCVCYPWIPGALNSKVGSQDQIIEWIADCIKKGLWLAMFIPYPQNQLYQVQGRHDLFDFFSDVAKKVDTLHRKILEKLVNNEDAWPRLGVFEPQNSSAEVVFPAMPPPNQWHIRPMLLKHGPLDEVGKNPEIKEKAAQSSFYQTGSFVLDSWVTTNGSNSDGQDDFIQMIYKQQLPGTGMELLSLWRDYFREVILSWIQNSGKSWGTLPANSCWKKRL